MTHTTEANQTLNYTLADVMRELCTALDEEWDDDDEEWDYHSVTLHRPGHGWAVIIQSANAGTVLSVYTPGDSGNPFSALQVFPNVAPLSVAVAGVRAILDAQLDAIQAGAA